MVYGVWLGELAWEKNNRGVYLHGERSSLRKTHSFSAICKVGTSNSTSLERSKIDQ